MNSQSPIIEVVAAAIKYQDRYLVVRRGPNGGGAGHWEFPGGKVEPGENFEAALIREIQEELSIDIKVESKLGENSIVYDQRSLRIHLYLCRAVTDQIILIDHDQFEWTTPDQFSRFDWAPGDIPFLKLFK